MYRYYTTPETRQALIAESNRLIAGRRAAMNRHARDERETRADAGHRDDEPRDAEAFVDTVPYLAEA